MMNIKNLQSHYLSLLALTRFILGNIGLIVSMKSLPLEKRLEKRFYPLIAFTLTRLAYTLATTVGLTLIIPLWLLSFLRTILSLTATLMTTLQSILLQLVQHLIMDSEKTSS